MPPKLTRRAVIGLAVLVGYNHPAYNVVMVELARQNWLEVEARYLDGLVESEVLMTPLGQNKFDDFGKLALLGW